MMCCHGGNVARAVGAKHTLLKKHKMPSSFLETMGASRVMTDRPHEETLFRLRPAETDDYPLMLALYLEGAQKHLSKIGRWDQRRVTVQFRRGYRQSQARVICAGGKDIGWMQVAEFADRLHLRQIHLVASFRGNGIGTKLISELLKRAAALRKPVTLDVLHGNPARSLYLRLGFKQIGQDVDKIQMIWRPPPRG
jgi:ribosomal protein S18 acetylase RimI-like enzyme